jgi:demethylmenaquinone methyltransferase/2-methoxy-6-polyprenyl-1,4-benzoquinol methylase
MTADKSVRVRRVFSRIARRYDVMNSVLSFGQHKLWRRFAMRLLDVRPGMRVIDVAAGTGDWTLALAKAVRPGGKVVGLDFSPEMLEVAETKLARRPELRGVVEWVHGDAMQLPFPDNSFDLATIGFALRNVPDVPTVLREMQRVVREGGLVVSLELSKPEWAPWRTVYYFYFYRIVPLLGAVFAGDRDAYAWLPESLTDFPDRRGLEVLFRQAGLVDVRSYALAGGIAAVHIGRKVEANG